MESKTIQEYLQKKTVLVTGATGFLAMVFLEKILRVQPDVKKVYLLLRAPDINSARDRMHNEIIGKELFKVLREKMGAYFDSFISEKVVAIPGDVSSENLGVKDHKFRKEMFNEIQIILNSAATTKFDESEYIRSSSCVSFAKKCLKLEMLLHVSTAYVCGERAGLIAEDLSSSLIDDIINNNFELHEKKLVEEKLNERKAQGASEEIITRTMKDLGTERAKLYGWPNTYVFTKAIGEIFLHHSKDNLPLVIIRPTIVTSTYKEPFPGWTQGLRTIDSVFAGYGKGKLKCLLVDPMSVFDMIPVDMVVNSIISAIVVNANQSSSHIYHVGSSFRNPIKFCDIQDIMFRYFTKFPWVTKDGKPIKVAKFRMLRTMASFRMYMQIRFMIPLQVLKFVSKAPCQYFKDLYANYSRKLKLVMRMVELYKPYVLFKGIFDDTNSEVLQRATNESYIDAKEFNFDPNCIDWEDYIMKTHIPGLEKHVIVK
ncbi:alcohol-forming fatty acyl-CoA reductase-like [Pyrus ussuriensis x Pyrus communis]|uniref:Fatty acyl-CoA reductase n=1 Tax=Pyrus ussuriensis x Pyrus communis TaxID=2448454 RepID=A0A5N5FJ89_9ROSA|nr:alcohol-forming fatty acyl-CoA reductase-like [Pyrus ussuriensis x Pyrus communis]